MLSKTIVHLCLFVGTIFVCCMWASAVPDMEIPNQGAQCLYAHNALRAVNRAGPLEWDDKLAEESAVYAAKLVEENDLKHSSGPYGENLGMGWGGTPNCAATVYGWYDEYTKHDFNSNDFIYASGHFTQVVWNSTMKVGVGVAHSKSLNRWAVCARYTPPGNMAGAFLANVFPASGTIPSVDSLKADAANVTPFPKAPWEYQSKSSGRALVFWGKTEGPCSLYLWLLRAMPFIVCSIWMLFSG